MRLDQSLIQADYGAFNPRFMGVLLEFNTPEALRIALPELVESPHQDEPARAAEALDLDMGAIALATVKAHEVRHYHDFLVSPYSSVAFGMKLQAVSSGVHALGGVSHLPGEFMPIPIPAWLRMSQNERVSQIERWQGELGVPVEVVELPLLGDDDPFIGQPGQAMAIPVPETASTEEKVSLTIEIAARAYMKLEQVARGVEIQPTPTRLDPREMMEVSALTTQLAEVDRKYGTERAIDFFLFLREKRVNFAQLWGDVYLIARSLQGLPLDNGVNPEEFRATIQTIQSLIGWSLLGNYQFLNPGTSADPFMRFSRLWFALQSDPGFNLVSIDFNSSDSIQAAWDRWDGLAGLKGWRESIAKAYEVNLRRLARLEKDFEANPGNPQSGIMYAIAELLAEDQRLAITGLFEDARWFADPWRFVDGLYACNPIIRVALRGFAIKNSEQLESMSLPLRTIDVAGGKFITDLVLRPEVGSAKDDDFDLRLKIMEVFEEWNLLVDLAFKGHESIPTSRSTDVQQALAETVGKRLLSMVD